MKITATKKLSILLLSLACSAAAGLGVAFGGFGSATAAYAQSEKHVLPSVGEDVLLDELSALTGISREELKFYALSNGGTVEGLYNCYLDNKDVLVGEIATFLSDYSTGKLVNEGLSQISGEDWFVAPDEVGSYDFNGCRVSLVDTWTKFYTTKSAVTDDPLYWRAMSFQYGHNTIWRNIGDGVTRGAGIGNSYYNVNPVATVYWDSFWIWDIAWLEDGEQFEFGLYSDKAYNGKYMGAMSSQFWLEKYLTDKHYKVKDANPNKNGYSEGNYAGFFRDGDYSTPPADTDLATFGPAENLTKTLGDYKDEFSSSISPSNLAADGMWSNSSFIKWATSPLDGASGTIPASLPASNYGVGNHILRVSDDAPSGFYYMTFYYPTIGVFTDALTGYKTSLASTFQTSYNSLVGWPNWSYYCNYGVLVCRKGVNAPEIELGEGVSADRRSKTVNYTGVPQTMTLENDWGEGLSTVKIEKWDKVANAWVATTELTATPRPAKGTGTKAKVSYTSTNAGKYRVSYTPFRNWTDGTTTNAEYIFEIKPMKITKPSLVQEEGVIQSQNKKFVYANNRWQYISLYPVPKKWAKYNPGGLTEFNWSENGVLTLGRQTQGTYTITVSFKDNVNANGINVVWDDGTPDGSITDCVYTFEIGPEKVVVPDIIQDNGNIGDNKKEVTFNGATQSMSFMPIVPSQLLITVKNIDTGTDLVEGTDFETKQNTLTVSAYDAGHYKITIKVRDEYIFDNIKKELEYDLIIHEAEITAPIFDEPTAVGTVKTVTYGGEKVSIGSDGAMQDWVATLAFKNADEARISVSSSGLGQQAWGDSRLILSARSAGSYTVTFTPKKNYKWKSGVNPPTYTLVIEKLKIALPNLVNDKESGATFTSTLKSIGFGGKHTFSLNFPTLEETKDTPYTKRSSVFVIHNGNFEERWDESGNVVTFEGIEANTYTFTVTPTNNYCWPDGSTREINFTFKIVPVNVKALHMWGSDPLGGTALQQVPYAKDSGFKLKVSYDGEVKTVRIGNVGANGDAEKMYVTTGTSYNKKFFLLDEDGNFINSECEDPRLLPGMTVNEDNANGFLWVTASEAGTYRIAVIIENTNYWWDETASTMVVYTLLIDAQGIDQPPFNQSLCTGRDISGHFASDTATGVHSMTGVYYDVNFMLSANLAEKFRSFVEITDPYGNVYVHDATLNDVNVLDRAENALKTQYGVYTDWRGGKISLYAKDQGSYTWTLRITDPNYKWLSSARDANLKVVTYTIVIARSPVSGIEMHYVGDGDERLANTADGIVVNGKTNVRGSDGYSLIALTYDASTFSDAQKEIFFKRTNTSNLVNTGFSAQFNYAVKSYVMQDGYDVALLKPLDSNKIFNDDRLVLFALDAGRYEITITPNDNYCWNDTGKTTGSVTFTLIVKKRQLEKPVIMNDDDSKCDPTVGGKDTEFNYNYQTFRLFMEKYPQGYAVGSFEYQDKEHRIDPDVPPEESEFSYPVVEAEPGKTYHLNGEGTPIVNIGVDRDAKTLAVQARSAGEYLLKLTVSNANNYEFVSSIDKNKLQYIYNIAKLKVELPEAYLSTQLLDSADAAKKVFTNAQVTSPTAPDLVIKEKFLANTGYAVGTQYNGKYRTVYFYGSDITKGDFVFSVATLTDNGDDEYKEILPDDLLDGTTDKAGYYMFAAQAVNTYAISLEFVSKDFYWSGGTPNDKSMAKTFKFTITKNNLDVPKISTYDLEFVDDSYTVSFPYEIDFSGTTANGAVSRYIEINDVMLGEDLNAANSVNLSEYKYTNMTVRISAESTAGGVHMFKPTLAADGKGKVSFETSTDGLTADGGVVLGVYCVELEINPQNSAWNKGSADPVRRYYIKITKMQIERPYISASLVPSQSTLARREEYNGKEWSDALIIEHYENKYMTYDISASKIEAAGVSTTFVGPAVAEDAYKDVINIDTKADVGTYSFLVCLRSKDNMEWKAKVGETSTDGDDISLDFIIEPIKLAKPYIENSAKSPTVIGTTKTVIYKWDKGQLPNLVGQAQGLEIGNYWANSVNSADSSGDPVPNVMSYTVASGILDTGYPLYKENAFTVGGTSLATGSMKYNYFNNGLLEIRATGADRYVIRFKLTDNAVWADGSTDDIDITLIIKKIEVDDLKIYDTDPSTVKGNAKTVMYKLIGNAEEVKNLDLTGYDSDTMRAATLFSGTALNVLSNAAATVNGKNGYSFTASKAGEYVFEFKLKDGANFRWKYADTDVAYFKLIIKKLELADPTLYTEYKLPNESINLANRTLTVDFDLREHTILVKSLFENLNNGAYDNGGAGYGPLYFTVSNATNYNGTNFTAVTHASQDMAYDATNGAAAHTLFEILGSFSGGYSYDGIKKNDSVYLNNLFALTAYKPGEYILKFAITDKANMVWANGSGDDIEFRIVISKVSHKAPDYAPGDVTTKQYTGEAVSFKIVNAFNGVNEAGGAAVGTVSEEYAVTSYVDTAGNVTMLPTAANLPSLANVEGSWFNGSLTLNFLEVGTYNVRVKIKDTDNISWSDSSLTYRDFTFVVAPRELKVEIGFEALTDPYNVNGALAAGGTTWPLSTQVNAVITFRGVRHIAGGTTIDDLLGFSIYYEDPVNGLGTPIGKLDIDNTSGWLTVGPLTTDGTFIVRFNYANIAYGKGNIGRGKYVLHIVQHNAVALYPGSCPSNYSIIDPELVFNVEADPAPFKGRENMLQWYYNSSENPGVDIPIANIGGTSDNRFAALTYKELASGPVTYSFYPKLNAIGMAGYNGELSSSTSVTFADALRSWKVKWDPATYTGDQTISRAGDFEVTIIISAYDPDEFAYTDYEFTLYYRINKAVYNLNALAWNYDGSTTYTFNGSAQSVKVEDLTLPQYNARLQIDHYETTGTFVSYNIDGNVNRAIPIARTNAMTYAGRYTTKVFFRSADANYAVPVVTNKDTYGGSFVWSVDWEITPAHIEVDWVTSTTSTSTGDVITKKAPAVAGAHSGKFDYKYHLWDTDLPVPAWVPKTTIQRVPGKTFKYKAFAYLKSSPDTPSTDYARNYTYEFIGKTADTGNPVEFEVGGNDLVIINHIEVGGTKTNGEAINPVTINATTAIAFEYTGNPFKAENIIDLDTTNGYLSSLRVSLLYYNAAAPTVSLSSAPSAVGSYIVKLKISYTDTPEDYAFAVTEGKFDIVRAKIKYSDFDWVIKHNDGNKDITAKLVGGKWIDVNDGKALELVYDSHLYELTLSSDYPSSVINILYTENNKKDAGSYTATITPSIPAANVDNYEFDVTDIFPSTYAWTIDKQFLDLSRVEWDYTKPFEFTIVNGVPKAFAVALKNLPEYLLDKIAYSTVRVNQSTETNEPGPITNAGNYKTTVSYKLDGNNNDYIDRNNYVLDNWPSAPFSTTLAWTIDMKKLELPVNDLSWTEFDGVPHNLLKPFKLDVDWNEYFDVDVTWNLVGYDGTAKYGGKYFAYDAGVYKFTLKIKASFNADGQKNIVWVVRQGLTTTLRDDNQTVSYTIGKKALKVTGWVRNYENSKVVLAGGIDPSKFIDYEFYEGNSGSAGTKTDLDTILNSAGNEVFSMVPIVKKAYAGNITLAFASSGDQYTSFTTQPIDQQSAVKVNDKPYIYGYTVDGVFKRFSNAELASGKAEVIYTGKQVEFKIYNWDNYYSDYLTVNNCSLDDLKQTQVGNYSVTLVLRKDLAHPLYWGVKDNKLDRSSVVLEFSISYRMLTIPVLPAEVVYEKNKEINILSKATNITLAQLTEQYGDYVKISNNIGNSVGERILYLEIKDEYGNAVRWKDGSEQGLAGTYRKSWKITPILLLYPVKNADKATVIYDEKIHTVYEYLKDYNAEAIPQSIKDLIKNVKATDAESVDAGDFTAILSLPDDNYAWNENGKPSANRQPVQIKWSIGKKVIDFTQAYWGYMEGDTPVKYENKPFVYSVSNGAPEYYTMQIMGMPEILKLYATYKTNGVAGNSACKVDTYVTNVVFDLSKIDTKNYTLANQLADEKSSIEWKIVPREFDLPRYEDGWTVYDGAVHDVIALLGLGDDWANYFNVKVEYKEIEGGSYADYKGEDKLSVGYSNYKLYDYGFYKVTVSLIANDPVWIPGTNIKWKGGTSPEAFVIEVSPRDVVIVGWNEDNEYSTVRFKDDGILPAGIAEKFKYVIYEDGDVNKTPVKPEDVKGSTTYYIEYVVKSGANSVGVQYSYGVNLVLENTVNPYEFGKFDFGAQGIIWMPIPVLEKASVEYNGAQQTFVIKDFDTLYRLTDAQKLQLNTNPNNNVNLSSSVKSFVYLQDSKALTVTAAGTYTAVVRLLGQVRLSWYDSTLYDSGDEGRTLYEKGTTNVVYNTDKLFNNKSCVLTFEVTPKRVPMLSEEDMEKLLGLVVNYDGKEKDLTQEAKEVFAELEAKYGKIFDYGGNKGTAADVYRLVISLADNDSCSWYDPNDKLETEPKSIAALDGYRLDYVFEDGAWKLAVVKVDENGNVVKDAANKPVEYVDPDGKYNIDVKYQPKFTTEIVPVDVDGDGSKLLINADGTIVEANNHFFKDNGDYATDSDGNPVLYEYVRGANGEIIRYKENLPAGSGTYTELTSSDADYNNMSVVCVKRYELSLTDGNRDYGYKKLITEDATEYTYLYSSLAIGGNGKPAPAKGLDGKYITRYLVYESGAYHLREYTVDTYGLFELDPFNEPSYTEVEAACEMVSATTRYGVSDGKLGPDSSGPYMLRYVLNSDGTKKQTTSYEKDENGNYVIDQNKSAVNVEKYGAAKGEYLIERDEDGRVKVTRTESDDLRYKLDWKIDSSVLAAPVFDEALMQQYAGKTLYAKDVLKGFIPELMKIEEGGEGVEAGTYKAKIVLTTSNSKWNPEITTENYVYVTWRIDTFKADLSNIKWVFNDGEKTYDDSSSFVYTRKDGKPVVYWVELGNIPEVLKSRVVYKTNDVEGGYAGVNAGKYVTSFRFADTDKNFATIELPETFAPEITWSIKRRELKIPETTSVFTVFDNEAHDLLKLLGVPSDWNEYYDIEVKYSNGEEYEPYVGHEGNPYVAYKSGTYMFTFAIKQGVNVIPSIPNAVWLKNSGETEIPSRLEAEQSLEAEPEIAPAPPAVIPALIREELRAEEEEVVPEIAEEVALGGQPAVRAAVKSEAVVALEQVCGKIKELVCGAQVQTDSFRKFSMRGTL